MVRSKLENEINAINTNNNIMGYGMFCATILLEIVRVISNFNDCVNVYIDCCCTRYIIMFIIGIMIAKQCKLSKIHSACTSIQHCRKKNKKAFVVFFVFLSNDRSVIKQKLAQ